VQVEGTTPTRVRAFDGLRGLAVAAVVCFHAQLPGARGGFLGVSAFFTLSGYLITTLLLDERERSGRVSLSAFWSRRARRLLPAAFLALAAIVVFGSSVATADQARALRGDVLSALAHAANWRFYFSGQSYSALFSEPSPVLHFWSLAIEEQFYVLFPVVVALALRFGRGRRTFLTALVVAGIGASVVAAFAMSDATSRVYYGTDTRAAELLVGALLAIVLHRRAGGPSSVRAPLAATIAGVAALTAMAVLWSTVDQTDAWLARGGFTMHACLAATVIAAARYEGVLATTLSWRPLVALGTISYGVYLFHWPLFLWLTPERTGLGTVPLFVLRVSLAVAAAALSYRYLEQPIRHGDRVRGAWPRILTPAAVAAVVAGCVAVTSAAPQPQVILHAIGGTSPDTKLATARAPGTTLTTPTVTSLHRALDGSRPLRVMVVGDSVGLTFGRGVELWARQHGAQVLNVARTWCALGRTLPRVLPDGIKAPGSCADWPQRWPPMLDSFDPDVVLVMYTVWEGLPRQLPDGSTIASPGDPEIDRWQLAEYQAATDILAARGAHVVWFTVPCGTERIGPSDPLWHVNRRTLPKLAASRPAAHVIDLDRELCRGARADAPSSYAGIADARPDARHFSDAGALALAGWVMPIVEGAVAAPQMPVQH
jgi:peptidoglycan/LPS O-acetylase OafA/YrhL